MRLDLLVQNYREAILSSLQECIRIRSVKASAVQDAPFGQDIQDALLWALQLGRTMGFTVKNFNGYAGSIEFGTGELLGILGHLDVVPEGDGWSVPPFSGVIQNDSIYGRGALDDKGPTLAALYAMKILKDSGLPLRRRIRLILGTDEESGWADMEYYTKHEQLPIEGFAPDGGFPVIHAEKGILHLELSKKTPVFNHIVSIVSGERANVVPDRCTVVLQKISTETINACLVGSVFPPGVAIEMDSQDPIQTILYVKGVGAHGSLPQEGKNALLYALDFLQTLPLDVPELELIHWILRHPGQGFNGEGLQIHYDDEISGLLSLNLGICELHNGLLRLILDIRYPVTFHLAQIIDPIRTICSAEQIDIKILSEQPPHHVPKDSILVQTLLAAYAKVTGKAAYAYAIGGGTYAKVMPNGVAFGPAYPGEPEGVHCADEHITIDHLLVMTQIYAQALLDIATVV